MKQAAESLGGIFSSVGTYAHRVVLAVWFPGFVVFCELAYFYLALSTDGSHVGEQLRTFISLFDLPVIGISLTIVVLAGSMALGYVARDLAYWITDIWMWTGVRPTRSLKTMLSEIKAAHGEEEVEAVFSRYKVFLLADDENVSRSLPRRKETYVREFCKLWLKVCSPQLSTEGLETEINMDIGTVIPLFLASVILATLVGSATALGFSIALFAFALLRLYRVTWAINIETEIAIVNFVYAHWRQDELRCADGKPVAPQSN
ncbi:MAG TPA: hypothetical protein VEX35_03735 [Allosphingosinicella sp.]|nr:hypothetical protein [Allosphingosinicella sp.]